MRSTLWRPQRKRFYAAGLLGLGLLVYLIRRADLDELIAALRTLDLPWLVPVLASSLLSYLCIGAVLHRLLHGIHQPLGFAAAFRISLISCVLNSLMALAGLSGIAAKVYLLARERIAPSQTLSVSMVHGFLTNTVAVVLVYFGVFYLVSHHSLGRNQLGLAALILLLSLGLTWFTAQLLLSASFRARCWNTTLGVGLWLCRKIGRPGWINRSQSDAFFTHFDAGMKLLTGSNRPLWGAAAYALADWVFTFLCLVCAFQAARCPAGLEVLLAGFSVAIFTALFALTPAGIGLMEGSMVASFYWLGLDYDRALVAVLIYRSAYHFLPLLLSLLYFQGSGPDPDFDPDPLPPEAPGDPSG